MALIDTIQTFANTLIGKTYEEAGIKTRFRKTKEGGTVAVTELSKTLYTAASLDIKDFLITYDLQEDASGDPDGQHKEKVKITGITVKAVYQKVSDPDNYVISRSDMGSGKVGIYKKVV